MEDVIKDFEIKCKTSIEAFEADLNGMRTGRASTGLIENIMVDYHGSSVPLKQLGLINAPEARQLTVQVYDASATEMVQKAISMSDLGLNPSSEGNLIRITIPALTEERRAVLVRSLKESAEKYKTSIRGHRQKCNDLIKKMEKDKEVSSDDAKKIKDNVQKVTDKYTEQVTTIFSAKEKEMMEV